ncbi:hypothetical protein TNCV_4141811 [Trichonephila clavipes]|nr:hypothetical protein TNCV_4141811 [Trichonephila clavipes]
MSSTKNGFYGNPLQGERGELLGRIDRQNSSFRTAKTVIIKFGLHAFFVELESAKNALNEMCRCKAKAGLRRSTPHTNTIVITAEIESGFARVAKPGSILL